MANRLGLTVTDPSALLADWLNSVVDARRKTDGRHLERDLSSGYLLAEILYRYGVLESLNDFRLRDSVEARTMNFIYLEPALAKTGYQLSPHDVRAIILELEMHRGKATRILKHLQGLFRHRAVSRLTGGSVLQTVRRSGLEPNTTDQASAPFRQRLLQLLPKPDEHIHIERRLQQRPMSTEDQMRTAYDASQEQQRQVLARHRRNTQARLQEAQIKTEGKYESVGLPPRPPPRLKPLTARELQQKKEDEEAVANLDEISERFERQEQLRLRVREEAERKRRAALPEPGFVKRSIGIRSFSYSAHIRPDTPPLDLCSRAKSSSAARTHVSASEQHIRPKTVDEANAARIARFHERLNEMKTAERLRGTASELQKKYVYERPPGVYLNFTNVDNRKEKGRSKCTFTWPYSDLLMTQRPSDTEGQEGSVEYVKQLRERRKAMEHDMRHSNYCRAEQLMKIFQMQWSKSSDRHLSFVEEISQGRHPACVRRIIAQFHCFATREKEEILGKVKLYHETEAQNKLERLQAEMDQKQEAVVQEGKAFIARLTAVKDYVKEVDRKKRQRAMEKQMKILQEEARSLVNYTLKLCEYREKTGGSVPPRLESALKRILLLCGTPFFSKHPQLNEAGRLPPAVRASAADHTELEADKLEFEEYEDCTGLWMCNFPPPADESKAPVTLPPKGNFILSHVLRRLQLIASPPKVGRMLPVLPKTILKACCIGKPCAGKTSLLRKIAQRHNLSVISLEDMLERAVQCFEQESVEVSKNRSLIEQQAREKQLEEERLKAEAAQREQEEAAKKASLDLSPVTKSKSRLRGEGSVSRSDTSLRTSRGSRSKVMKKKAGSGSAQVYGVDASSEGEGVTRVVSETDLIEPLQFTRLAELGELVKKAQADNRPLSDNDLMDLVVEAVRVLPEGTGWILDGFPETLKQAQLLEDSFTGSRPSKIVVVTSTSDLTRFIPYAKGSPVEVKISRLLPAVVEGHHPAVTSFLDLVLFLDVQDETSIQRYLAQGITNEVKRELGLHSLDDSLPDEETIRDCSGDPEQLQVVTRLKHFKDNWPHMKVWYDIFELVKSVSGEQSIDSAVNAVDSWITEALEKNARPPTPPSEPTQTPKPGDVSSGGPLTSQAITEDRVVETPPAEKASSPSKLSDTPKTPQSSSSNLKKAPPRSSTASSKGRDSPVKEAKEMGVKKGAKPGKGAGKQRVASKTPVMSPPPPEPEAKPDVPPPPPKLVPGDKDYVFIEEPVEKDLAACLVRAWSTLEQEYRRACERSFRELRLQCDNQVNFLFWTKMDLLEFYRRPDTKTMYLRNFYRQAKDESIGRDTAMSELEAAGQEDSVVSPQGMEGAQTEPLMSPDQPTGSEDPSTNDDRTPLSQKKPAMTPVDSDGAVQAGGSQLTSPATEREGLPCENDDGYGSFLGKEPFNSTEPGQRRSEVYKSNVHTNVEELEEQLLAVCDDRLRENAEELHTHQQNGYVEDHIGQITNTFINLMQAELTRYYKTCQILEDYYQSAQGKQAVEHAKWTTRIPLIEVPKIIRPPEPEESSLSSVTPVESSLSKKEESKKIESSEAPAKGKKGEKGKKAGKEEKTSKVEEKPPEAPKAEQKPQKAQKPKHPFTLVPQKGHLVKTPTPAQDESVASVKKKAPKEKTPLEESAEQPENLDEQNLLEAGVSALAMGTELLTTTRSKITKTSASEKAGEAAKAAVAKQPPAGKGGKGKAADKKKAPTKSRSKSKMSDQSVSPTPTAPAAPEEMEKAEKIQEECLAALAIEDERFKARIEQLRHLGLQTFQELKANAERMATDVTNISESVIAAEKESVRAVSAFLRQQLESESPVESQLQNTGAVFEIDQSIVEFETLPEETPVGDENLVDPYTERISTIHGLSLALKGYENVTKHILDEMAVVHGLYITAEEFDALKMLPSGEVILPQCLLRLSVGVEMEFSAEQLVTGYLKMQSFDTDKTGLLSKEKFMMIPCWLEGEQAEGSVFYALWSSQPTFISEVWFDIFSEDEETVDYKKMLLHFCYASSTQQAFVKVLSVELMSTVQGDKVPTKEAITALESLLPFYPDENTAEISKRLRDKVHHRSKFSGNPNLISLDEFFNIDAVDVILRECSLP